MIKAVFFDLDGTLLDRDASAEAYARALHAQLAVAATLAAFCARFRELHDHGYGDKEALFEALVEEFRLSISPEELVADCRRNAWTECVTFPRTEDLLRQLREEGYALGIVTNGTAESQRAKLRNSGLDQLVDVTVVSGEERVKKPDPAIFLRAAARMGVEATECVFVGDNPVADIGGAHGVGMATAWVGDASEWPEEVSTRPDLVVSGVGELLGLSFERLRGQ